jgi:hypothetical protein
MSLLLPVAIRLTCHSVRGFTSTVGQIWRAVLWILTPG